MTHRARTKRVSTLLFAPFVFLVLRRAPGACAHPRTALLLCSPLPLRGSIVGLPGFILELLGSTLEPPGSHTAAGAAGAGLTLAADASRGGLSGHGGAAAQFGLVVFARCRSLGAHWLLYEPSALGIEVLFDRALYLALARPARASVSRSGTAVDWVIGVAPMTVGATVEACPRSAGSFDPLGISVRIIARGGKRSGSSLTVSATAKASAVALARPAREGDARRTVEAIKMGSLRPQPRAP